MEFYIDSHSSIPLMIQIQEQVKLAVAMGVLRKGDTLPSIRDIEKQTGVHRSQIHRAYQALKQSGLLALTRGKGTVVAAAVDSPAPTNEQCLRLSAQTTLKARRMGISPIAFARYLGRYAQENERSSPFLWYVDIDKEIAQQAAAEISRLWQVPVSGLTVRELKSAVRRSNSRHRILVHQHLYETVRQMLPKNKSAVIRIEEQAWNEDTRFLEKIRENSSVLFLHLPQPVFRVHFIVTNLREMLASRGIRVDSAPVRNMKTFRERIRSTRYDYYIVGPAARGMIPPEMQQDPRILPIRPQLDPASLEAARIRAGVII